MKPNDIARFMKKVEKTESCWIWTGGINKGYAVFYLNDGMKSAHRLMYEYIHGEILPDHEIDHTCFNKSCVRPEHLEMVTRSVNTRRGVKRRTNLVENTYIPTETEYCKNKHLRTIQNTYVYKNQKKCRVCQLDAVNKYNLARKLA